jgi:hypothetical protein
MQAIRQRTVPSTVKHKMKIAILGGTGSTGEGFALRWDVCVRLTGPAYGFKYGRVHYSTAAQSRPDERA